MKRSLLVAGSFFVLCSHVFAADMTAPVYKAAPMFDWSGFYAGAHGGYATSDDHVFDSVPGNNYKINSDGGFGGVQIGYNSQFAPHWLIGSEIDFSWGSLNGSSTAGPGLIGQENIDFFGTARTRLGFIQDRMIYYVTGGVAWTHAHYGTLGGGSPVTGVNRYDIGATIGAGIEYAVDDRWSLKLEYLYASFDQSHPVSNAGVVGYSFDPSMSIVKAGVNYKFGPVAQANNIPVKSVTSRSNWEGGYFGVHGGYGSSDYHQFDSLASTNWRFKADGEFGGVQGGYNWVYAPSMLLGIETDSSWGDLNGNQTVTGRTVHARIDDIGTIRGRWGFIRDSNLFYLTGGGAYAQEKADISTGLGLTSKMGHFGWTAGTGIESKFAPDWSWKIEYLYADFSHAKAHDLGGHDVYDFSSSTVKVGVNYAGPLIERLFTGSLYQ